MAEKSCSRESITRRGRCVRASLRPSGASDREPAVRRERGDRPSFSSGRGSRAPWRDGASWAGRSASSGLRVILSIRPRGLVSCVTPRGTQTRLGAQERIRRVRRPGDHRPGPERVSNRSPLRSAPTRVLRHPSVRPARPVPARSRYSFRVPAIRLATAGRAVLSFRNRWPDRPAGPLKRPGRRPDPVPQVEVSRPTAAFPTAAEFAHSRP